MLKEIVYKQRAYDGKWIRLSKVSDVENSYTFRNEEGRKETLVPSKWIVTGVYDYEMEIV